MFVVVFDIVVVFVFVAVLLVVPSSHVVVGFERNGVTGVPSMGFAILLLLFLPFSTLSLSHPFDVFLVRGVFLVFFVCLGRLGG